MRLCVCVADETLFKLIVSRSKEKKHKTDTQRRRRKSTIQQMGKQTVYENNG